jgi:hypothetical protein
LSHHYSVEMPLYNGPHSSYLSLWPKFIP